MGPVPSRTDESVSRTSLPSNALAAGGARRFVRSVLAGRTAAAAVPERIVDDALLLVSELVTNAVMHAGTDIEVVCRLETRQAPPAPAAPERAGTGAGSPAPGERMGVVVEVADRHPSSVVRAPMDAQRRGRGVGLQLVSALAESWGVTYRHTEKAVWFRLENTKEEPEFAGLLTSATPAEPRVVEPPAPLGDRRGSTAEWSDRGGPSFLDETSELLAGQLDEDLVAALAGQLLVPRLADWCGVWLSTDAGGMRLSRVWHADERRIRALRHDLEKDQPPDRVRTTAVPWPWPESADTSGSGGVALAFPLLAGGASLGVLLLGREGHLQMTDAVAQMVEHLARRVAQAVVTARRYTQQATISQALQRGQLPLSLASIPGVETAIVYEPHGEGQTVGGDFYDLFPMGDRRWCFLLGDVQGKDPEAMSVTGLARHLVRLLAREGHGVASVLSRLNTALAEESEEAVALGGEQARPRFLSLLYGELEIRPDMGGANCTVASAGHPLPLHLSVAGSVEPATDPQMLLGIVEGTEFNATDFILAPGETLLCVTDGVTERRSGNWQFDDDDGLAEVLRECAGLGAEAVAERVRQAAHDFGNTPVEDDLSVLVFHALRVPSAGRSHQDQ
ncbi:SpoIIE family protein phosphatase [Streptomyces sp. NBC_00440]|uniref:SpoIIE family protein phosphatase n=1 Tax=Streptomyces sp. NBC_00440 TaxID=2975741 RepID=UPI002E1B1E9E